MRCCPKTCAAARSSSKHHGKPLNHGDQSGPPEGNPTTQAIVQLTDIGLAWKLTPKEALVYAFSCETGTPLPGVKLQLFGEDATALDHATTDASGLATLPRLDPARHLQASLGEDTYLTAFDSTLATVGLWHFPVRYSWNKPPESSRKAFLFTDRSLYRPGETVRLKGIIRNLHGNAIETAKTGPARIVILDPTEKEILSQPVTISATGSFDFTHTLAPAKTGTHSIRLEFPRGTRKSRGKRRPPKKPPNWIGRSSENILENARFDLPLRVEEFRRNAFEITQKLATPAIGATTVAADLTAQILSGPGGGRRRRQTLQPRHHPTTPTPNASAISSSATTAPTTGAIGITTSATAMTTTKTPPATPPNSKAKPSSPPMAPPPSPSKSPRPISPPRAKSRFHPKSPMPTTRHSPPEHPPPCIRPPFMSASRASIASSAPVRPLPLKIAAIDTAEQPFGQALKLTATLTREVNSAVKSQTARRRHHHPQRRHRGNRHHHRTHPRSRRFRPRRPAILRHPEVQRPAFPHPPRHRPPRPPLRHRHQLPRLRHQRIPVAL